MQPNLGDSNVGSTIKQRNFARSEEGSISVCLMCTAYDL